MSADGVEQAIRDLTGEVGHLSGLLEGHTHRMDDMGREIGELRKLIKEEGQKKDSCCKDCRNEIDSELTSQGKRITSIEKKHDGEKAVSALLDTTLGRISVCIGILTGSAVLFVQFVLPAILKVMS